MSLSPEETLNRSITASSEFEQNEIIDDQKVETILADQKFEDTVIDNEQFVNRCTFMHPFTNQLISSNFTEKNGNALSVYWQKHCKNDQEVHDRGLSLLSKRLERQPDSKEKYLGFVSLAVIDIRAIQSSDDYCFDVIYCPDDIEYDIAHSHIQIMKDGNTFGGKVSRNTRRELIDEGILQLLNTMTLKEYEA
ncbi:hypothetical protein F935_01526 [Acinetobacter calcoaceticus ANC 3811]|uniref:Uncharacterized protein n=1 Tax=Acinetobacter calcoaceticus ANC 3811 TaxID=1217690 RepID=R8Y439_ACICA|nr:hypothetical protein [Acinetobacter calcoaceticus]EOQ63896.1 hypothetical protein F935_01526 [Acinetobacter calcoaceticus ANC 3811]